MKNKILTTLALFGALASMPAAFGNTITLNTLSGHVYQQSIQSPCIFANASCTGSFPNTLLPSGSVTGYDALSPVYTGSQLISIIGSGNPLIIGVDINQANTAQTLSSFTLATCANTTCASPTVIDTFTGSTGNVPKQSNGNGWADFSLTGFSSISANTLYQFHFVFTDANDGTEDIFLVGAPTTATPEPISLSLVGGGLLAIGFLRKRIGKRA